MTMQRTTLEQQAPLPPAPLGYCAGYVPKLFSSFPRLGLSALGSLVQTLLLGSPLRRKIIERGFSDHLSTTR